MKFVWCIAVVLVVSCFVGEALGMFGKSTEVVLFEAIVHNNNEQAMQAIDAPSKMLMKTYATNLAQTADIEIKKAVEITTAEGDQVSVKKLKNTTPLILAVLLGRSKIVHKLVKERKENNRLIGHQMEATLSYIDKNKTPQELTVSAIECAQLCANQKLVQYFIAKKIGTKLNIDAAREWIKKRKDGSKSVSAAEKLELENKLETLKELLAKLKEKLNQLRQSLKQLKANLTI